MACCVLWTSVVVGQEPLEYTLRFPDAKNHYLDVELRVPAGDQRPTELMMAVWTPGSYLIREYARHLEEIRAFDTDDQPLAIRKKGKNRWLLNSRSGEVATVSYRLYCREMSVRTNWVEGEFAILNGAPTFLTLAEDTDRPCRVRIELPPGWKQSVTSLNRVSDGDPHHYEAADFDELVDSPILCGNPNVYRFTVGDHEHLLVNQGEGGLWDGAAAARDVAKIVAQQQQLWGVVPYERYVFFNLITESGGGLEHDNSTLLMTSRWNYRPRASYLRWLGLVSHEFFHTWNIRRLRPVPLLRYDYESENFTRSLWVAEGVTSYYENLCLIRGGVCSKKEFLELLSKDIEAVQSAPGRLVQSLRDSSHDTWIKFYRPDENTVNSRISYYTKGAVVAFLLDAKIRGETAGTKSLDEVMRILYERHAGQRGYRPEDFRAIVAEVSGTNLAAWFQSHIDSANELEYGEALEWYGLEFKEPKAKEASISDQDQPAQKDAEKPKPWLGISTRDSNGRLMVTRVLRGSPASTAGINPDDEIVALGDYRVGPGAWESRLEEYRPGEAADVLGSRRGRLARLDITFGEEPLKRWKLAESKKATKEQRRRLSEWLGIEESAAER